MVSHAGQLRSSTPLVGGPCGALRSPREDAQAGGDALRLPIKRALCREAWPIHFPGFPREVVVVARPKGWVSYTTCALVHHLGADASSSPAAVFARRRGSLIPAHRVQSLFGSLRARRSVGEVTVRQLKPGDKPDGCGDRRGCPNLPRWERHTNYSSSRFVRPEWSAL
jgi:hypothetical protein